MSVDLESIKRKYKDTGIICKINEVTKEQKEEVI